MHPSWRIPEDTEKPFRKALDHASRHEVSEMYSMLEQLTREQLEGAAGLCGLVSAYTVINAVSRRWPTDAELRHMAKLITEGENHCEQYGVTEQNIYLWVSQCALGLKSYTEIFGDVFDDGYEFMAAPFFFTFDLLAWFHPKDTSVGDFLNLIETAYETASLIDLNLLPALMVRSRMPQPEQAPDTTD